MKDKTLTYLSLSIFILGLLLFYFSSLRVEVKPVKISEITNEFVGETVIIEGNISYIKRSESGIFMVIDDGSGKMFVPIFSGLVNQLDRNVYDALSVGKVVRIKGYVDSYKDSLEVVPSCKECIKIIA